MNRAWAIDSIPPDAAGTIRARSAALREALAAASGEQLLELVLQLHEDGEAWRFIAGQRLEKLQAVQMAASAPRRAGALKKNAASEPARRFAHEHWTAWRTQGVEHESRAKNEAELISWLLDMDPIRDDPDRKSIEKLFKKWRERATENAEFVAAVERGDYPQR